VNVKPESDRFWTWSNVVSLVRLVMTVPVVMAMMDGHNLVAFVLCWIAAFTDYLDGRVARATGTVSEWGKVIDPVADKVFVGAVVVVLLWQHLLPLWFVVAVVARDVVIVIGGFVARRYTPVVLPSLMSGKLAVTAIALTGVIAMMEWTLARDIGIVLSCIMMLVSLWAYGKRLYGIIR